MVISLISARYVFTFLFAPRIHKDNGTEVFSNHRRLRKLRGILLYNKQRGIFTITVEYKAMTKIMQKTPQRQTKNLRFAFSIRKTYRIFLNFAVK